MDTVISGAEIARRTNTSIPRVARAAQRLGIERRANGRFALTPAQAKRLRHELGFVPDIDGLSRSAVMVLAALRGAPLGLVSTRAVARRSTLSPTAAGRALDALLHERLVTRRDEVVAAGRAREMTVWRANVTHPRWHALSPLLDQVELPERRRDPRGHRQGGNARVPGHLRHLFWNTAPEQLDVESSGPYIARRLLRALDLQGLAWGAKTLDAEDWLEGARARGLDPSVRRLARNLAAGAGVAAHLRHRKSRDLGLFSHLAEPQTVAGMRVGDLRDLMAMKIKVLAERGEARDYFDVRMIDEIGGISVEEGIELYIERYQVDPSSGALPHLYLALGDLSDVEEDAALPMTRRELQAWWGKRQLRVLRDSDRFS